MAETRICKTCGTTLSKLRDATEAGPAQWWCPACDPNHLNLLDIEQTVLESEVSMTRPKWYEELRKEKEERGKVKSDVDISFPDKDLAEKEAMWQESEGAKKIEEEQEELKRRRKT